MAVPEHVLVVDLEEPHGPGADDEVGHVDEHVEEQEPRAAPHSAPFPEMNSATFLAVNSKQVISQLVRVLAALRRKLRYRGGGGTGSVFCNNKLIFEFLAFLQGSNPSATPPFF